MFCKQCGTKLDDQAKFCQNCGAPVGGSKPAVETPSPAPLPSTPPNKPAQSSIKQAPVKGKKKKGCLSTALKVLGGFVIFSVVIGIIFGEPTPAEGSDNSEKSSASSSASSSSKSEDPVYIPDESEIKPVDYNYLLEASEDYKGSYVRIAGPVTNSTNSRITIDSTVDADIANDFEPIDDGVYITVVGRCEGALLGAVQLDDSYIEERGEASQALHESLLADANGLRTSKTDAYKSACVSIDYEDFARNPDTHEGEQVKLYGEVIQVQEGIFGSITLRVATSGHYDDIVWVEYTLKDGESRILEGDLISVYGEFKGIKSYITVLGSQMSIPAVNAKYIVM